MRKTSGKDSNALLARRTPMRPVEDSTRPRAMVPPWLLASALLPRIIAKTAAPRDCNAPRSSIIEGPRLRASWKYRGRNGEVILHAKAAPARYRRSDPSRRDLGNSSLGDLVSFSSAGCGFMKKRTIVEIEKNTNVSMKMSRTEIQLRRKLPTSGEKTTPSGADAQVMPKFDADLVFSAAPAMYALKAGILNPDTWRRTIPGITSVQVLAK
jgi:hypothetical protein